MNRNENSTSIGYYAGNKTLAMSPSNTLRLCSCNAAKLEDELMQLRESTKHALKASWDEVEALQCENSKLIEKNASFEIDLAKLRQELKESKSHLEQANRKNDKLMQRQRKVDGSPTSSPIYKTVFTRRLSHDAKGPKLLKGETLFPLNDESTHKSLSSDSLLDPISILGTRPRTKGSTGSTTTSSGTKNESFSLLKRIPSFSNVSSSFKVKKTSNGSARRNESLRRSISSSMLTAAPQLSANSLFETSSFHSYPGFQQNSLRKVSFHDLVDNELLEEGSTARRERVSTRTRNERFVLKRNSGRAVSNNAKRIQSLATNRITGVKNRLSNSEHHCSERFVSKRNSGRERMQSLATIRTTGDSRLSKSEHCSPAIIDSSISNSPKEPTPLEPRVALDEKDLLIRTLEMKLMSRDETIDSMEQTIVENIKNMQELHVAQHGG
jgi:regulator of replication initiation timing